MSARIIISRKKEYFSRNAVFTVLLDGKEVANIIDKKIFTIDEGVKAVQLITRWKWIKTQTLIVKAADGQDILLSIRYGIKYFSILYALFLFSLLGNIFFITGKLARPDWYLKLQMGFLTVFILYVIISYILKKGVVWDLEEDRINEDYSSN